MDRRRFLVVAGASGLVAASPIRDSLLALARAADDGTFGPLGPPDGLGVRVPAGFSSRLVARSGDVVEGTAHVWHAAPDGAGCIPAGDHHVLVSNSEVGAGGGGVGAIRFDSSGKVVGAGSILAGTSRNCAGGVTPWRTWLSCEESGPTGQVWECDPFGRPARRRAALGSFNHEAAAVDAVTGRVYLTEDDPEGRLYRFTPDRFGDLSTGRLDAAEVVGGIVRWRPVDPGRPARSASTTLFDGGEGIAIEHRWLFFTTKGDRRIWELSLDSGALRVVHDAVADPTTALTHVDNVAVHPQSHHLFVAEDGGDMELCTVVLRPTGALIAPVVRFEGHDGSEVTGPTFSPDGLRLYVTSQRGVDGRGMTVCVEGPWVTYLQSIDTGATARRGAVRVRR